MSIERVYNINLRQKSKKAPKWRRAKKVANLLREFVARHMKTEKVKIGKELNEEIWKYGAKDPRPKYKIKVKKEGDTAYVNLFGVEEIKKEQIEKENKEKSEEKKEAKDKEEVKKEIKNDEKKE